MSEKNKAILTTANAAVADEDGTATHSTYCDVRRFRDGRMVELRAFVIGAGA